jgi:hypothetical protein
MSEDPTPYHTPAAGMTREDHLAVFESQVADLRRRMKDALSYLGRSQKIIFSLGSLECAENFLRMEQGKPCIPDDIELRNTEPLWTAQAQPGSEK